MIDQKKIRNFSIIAHIDHGKSTLSDRLIEKCGAVEQRIMEDQILDNMDLEKDGKAGYSSFWQYNSGSEVFEHV